MEDKEFKKVIFSDNLSKICSEEMVGYLAHALCIGGCAQFDFNGNKFKFSGHDLMIIRKGELVTNMTVSADFKVIVIYIEKGFIEHCTPQLNYGMKGQLALFLNPIMNLNEKQYNLCLQDFMCVKYRYETLGCTFYEEGLRCAIQLMIVDFFDFHSCLHGEDSITPQLASIMTRFLELLESGIYRTHREVSYYASELCVTPKYLSEVCKKVSGHSANFWINRYTSLDISRQLRNRNYTFVQIADMFNFSSAAYFSRYVQNNLGMSPSDYRD